MSGAVFKDAGEREAAISALETLVRSPGWELVKRDLERAQVLLVDGLAEMSNPNDALRSCGRLASIRQQLNYPTMMLKLAHAERKKDQEKHNEIRTAAVSSDDSSAHR